MAERLGEQAGREDWEAHGWHFTFEFLEDVLDGQTWHLKAGQDFPASKSFTNIRNRLYAAARSRGGTVWVYKPAHDVIAVRFEGVDQRRFGAGKVHRKEDESQ